MLSVPIDPVYFSQILKYMFDRHSVAVQLLIDQIHKKKGRIADLLQRLRRDMREVYLNTLQMWLRISNKFNENYVTLLDWIVISRHAIISRADWLKSIIKC